MTAPDTPPPPPGPGRDKPLDPNSPKGRDIAARLTQTLARIELEMAQEQAAGRIGRAA